MTAPVLDEYLTRDALAAELGVCATTLLRWQRIAKGPPVTRVGRRIMYRRASVAAWLARREEVQTNTTNRSR